MNSEQIFNKLLKDKKVKIKSLYGENSYFIPKELFIFSDIDNMHIIYGNLYSNNVFKKNTLIHIPNSKQFLLALSEDFEILEEPSSHLPDFL